MRHSGGAGAVPLPERQSHLRPPIRDTDRDNDWRSWFRVEEIQDFMASNQVFEDMVAVRNEDLLYADGEGSPSLRRKSTSRSSVTDLSCQ
jgi:hypothetical protein